jgi:hypothetical protein
VRRLSLASLALPMALLLATGPVAADTSPGGGSGTYFQSFTTSCTGNAARQVCTDTIVDSHPLEDGASEVCLDVYTYSINRNRFAFVSETFGCTPGSAVVESDYSVSVAPTEITTYTCAAHKKSCSGSPTTVTVSADDSPVGDPATTTSRTVTKVGGCTYTTRSTETDVELAGTMTIDGTTMDENGFVSVIDSTTTVRCK